MFSYPISKIKLLWGKILSVILIAFIAHFSAHFVIQLFIRFMAVVTESSYIPVANQLINLSGITFATVLIGLLPFVLGMMEAFNSYNNAYRTWFSSITFECKVQEVYLIILLITYSFGYLQVS